MLLSGRNEAGAEWMSPGGGNGLGTVWTPDLCFLRQRGTPYLGWTEYRIQAVWGWLQTLPYRSHWVQLGHSVAAGGRAHVAAWVKGWVAPSKAEFWQWTRLLTSILVLALSAQLCGIGEVPLPLSLIFSIYKGVTLIILAISLTELLCQQRRHMWNTLGRFQNAIEMLIIKCDFVTAETQCFL